MSDRRGRSSSTRARRSTTRCLRRCIAPWDGDRRVRFSFMASEEPGRARDLSRRGSEAHRPPRAAAMPVRCLPRPRTSCGRGCRKRHLPHPDVSRGRRQVRVRRAAELDAPWDRLFFVNRRRLSNCIDAGAIDADSAAIRLIGMPKVDCLVDGSLDATSILDCSASDPRADGPLRADLVARSSLNADRCRADRAPVSLPINLIVKLHDRSRDARPQYSGGIDWPARLQPPPRASGPRAMAGARRHLSVARRRRRHGDRSQFGRVRVPAARSAARPDPSSRS